MCTVAVAMLRSLRLGAGTPLVVLAVVSALSLARTALLGEPCQSPCTHAAQHTLIFDEAYYVNAARVIAGIHPPAGSHYADAPLGTDPNAEHPQLAKLIIAGGDRAVRRRPVRVADRQPVLRLDRDPGDLRARPRGRRRRWSAVGASALMACDNLLLVHGRIGTLDIYVVAMMIWGVALYLRGRLMGRARARGRGRVQGGRPLRAARARR